MSRNFPNFLDAYLEYANDGFIPPQFNLWSGLSIIAGALERKVWLPWSDTFSYYPNIYVLLVSIPGDGKSMALNTAVDLLKEMNRKSGTLNIMPNQVTEAKFIELMGHGRSFTDANGVVTFQNAGYYYASEASNELKNVYGDFIPCLTSFYDCPTHWKRATKKDLNPVELKNVCMNMLAGSTFDYLGKLVNDENIMGGFASRLIYVVSRNKEVHDQPFQQGISDPEIKQIRDNYRRALVEDLNSINKMIGPMHGDAEFAAAWEAWYPDFERKRRAMLSEKTQSIMARMNTNVLKVAMLLSVAESSERILKLKHWERALEIVSKVQLEAPSVFMQSRATTSDRASRNPAHMIINLVRTTRGITVKQLKNKLTINGIDDKITERMLHALVNDGTLGYGNHRADGIELVVLGDTDNHL